MLRNAKIAKKVSENENVDRSFVVFSRTANVSCEFLGDSNVFIGTNKVFENRSYCSVARFKVRTGFRWPNALSSLVYIRIKCFKLDHLVTSALNIGYTYMHCIVKH